MQMEQNYSAHENNWAQLSTKIEHKSRMNDKSTDSLFSMSNFCPIKSAWLHNMEDRLYCNHITKGASKYGHKKISNIILFGLVFLSWFIYTYVLGHLTLYSARICYGPPLERQSNTPRAAWWNLVALPYTVLESVMGRPWEDEIACPELLDETQALELGRVYHLDAQGV